MSLPPRNLQVQTSLVKDHQLFVQSFNTETNQLINRNGPIIPAHVDMSFARINDLSKNLIRSSDLDNLFMVVKHPRDLSRLRRWPFSHQVEDVETAIKLPWFFITSEMRTGKTKIVIDAAQFLYELGVIKRVIVIAPAPVRDVWFDQQLGELNKHLWTNSKITEFHTKNRTWLFNLQEWSDDRFMHWIVSNYEFVRIGVPDKWGDKPERHLAELMPFCGSKTLLVLDESSFIKGHDSKQTDACQRLRNACGRVILLNGTPISHNPRDLFSQGNMLHPSILECKFITHYESKYAIKEPVIGQGGKPLTSPRGFAIRVITGWRPEGLIDLQRRFAPCTVRRLQKDCLDLPPKLDAVSITAPLTKATWKIYKSMRDDLVVWLNSGDVSVASQATIKVMRLSQITSGFLGGVEGANIENVDPEFFDSLLLPGVHSEEEVGTWQEQVSRHEAKEGVLPSQEIGREKLDVVLWFLGELLQQNPNLHVVVWCRFRAELFRMMTAVAEMYSQFETGSIFGAQKKPDRLRAMQLLHPDSSPEGPVCVGGTFGTGSFGINLSAASVCINVSADYSLGKFLQSQDRIYGPDMLQAAAYFNVLATGPDGQHTIDHVIEEARRNSEDIANWTTGQWIKRLRED